MAYTRHLKSKDICLALVVGILLSTAVKASAEAIPIGADFYNFKNTHMRKGGGGDNWTLTWAADDSVLVSMDDGDWINNSRTNRYSNALYRISNEGSNFAMANVSRIDTYPLYPYKKYCHFGHGLLSASGTIYSFISQCGEAAINAGNSELNWGDYFASKLIKSTDNGKSWKTVLPNGTTTSQGLNYVTTNCNSEHGYFFCKRGGRKIGNRTFYSFTMNAFVQAGRDYSERTDEYIYIYSPVPNLDQSASLELARAPMGQLENKSSWRYFTSYNSDGSANWSSNFSSRKATIYYPPEEGTGALSFLPDVVYNKDLKRYIMVNYRMTSKPASVHLYHSKKPYGPWTQFKFTKSFVVNDSSERTYQFKLNPKRITNNGKDMVLIWSDYSQDFGAPYVFNEMKFRIELGPESGTAAPLSPKQLQLRVNVRS